MNSTALKTITLTALSILGLIIMGGLTYAESSSAEEKIEELYNEFALILNDYHEPETIMGFLHEKVDKDASFIMKTSNPNVMNGQNTETVLSKADYINSYLYGPRLVDEYSININVEITESLSDKKSWVSRVIFVESGNMRSLYDVTAKPRPFSSFTTCDSVHAFANGKNELVVKQAKCSTEIFYEQEV